MKNNIGLIEHCEKALKEGWGYVYGTYGKVLTSSLLQNKLQQYPKEVKPRLHSEELHRKENRRLCRPDKSVPLVGCRWPCLHGKKQT